MRHSKRRAMAKDAADKTKDKKSRDHPIVSGVVAFLFVGLLGFAGQQLLLHPETPLPSHWNPTKPLRVSDPLTPISGWKLNTALATEASCLAALDGVASLQSLAPLETSNQCHIRQRVALGRVGDARVDRVETRCALALRMAMWERHSLQPAAEELLGTRVSGIDHFGSYSCRQMRTSAGTSGRMSTHATADAIDISGFRFANGTSTRLISDWDSGGAQAAFLRAARDGACDWFNLTLSPDYNSLHADHFHLQSVGWGLCR